MEYTEQTKDILFNQMLSCMSEGIIAIDKKLEVLFTNRAAARLSGRSEKLAAGKDVNQVFPLVLSHNLLPLIPAYLPQSGRPNYFFDVILRNCYGQSLLIDGCIARIIDEKEELSGYVLLFHDTSEIKRLTAVVNFHENNDPVTRLYNRDSFYVQLQILLDNCKRRTSNNAVLYIEIDDFRRINDISGIDTEDNILKQFATILRANIDRKDIPARLASDDFAVILRDCAREDSVAVAKRVLKTCEDYEFKHNGNILKITLSIGVYPISEDETNAKDTLDKAYRICKVSHEAGGNCVSSG
ncbi:hypothetical protein FACS1894190_08900 [Spirochaetia bacterium]|nr:hypothetical protein FACS1894190_08900 [Spirochaetia bacterium]